MFLSIKPHQFTPLLNRLPEINSGVLELHERLNSLDLTVPRIENSRPTNGHTKGSKSK